MEFVAQAKHCNAEIFDDFAATLNRSANCITEFAFADKGSSRFNRAMYVDKVEPSFLNEIASRECNVAFLADCAPEKISAPLKSLVFRQAKNKTIAKKSIISFDLDFKTINPEFLSMACISKLNFATAIAGKFIEKLQQSNLPVWIINYSGNGLHIHFKLEKPIPIVNAEAYRICYREWCDVLTLALGGGVTFDINCSNVARLMRLPLSTNWKNQTEPIKNLILFHQPHADATAFFSKPIVQPPSHTQITIQSFRKILQHFNYKKMATIEQKGEQLVCSSPFTSDSSPSFYFHPEKKVFYDFSRGRGGGLHTLIADLADKKSGSSRQEVEHFLDEILGHPYAEGSPNRYSLRKDGVWFNKDIDGDDAGLWICSPLMVKAMTRSKSGDFWGRVLSFNDQDGISKTFAMPMEMLAGDGLELRKELLRRGLNISQNRKVRHHLLEYIRTCDTKDRVFCVNRIGWHQNVYVLPHRIFRKEAAESYVLQREGDFAAFQTSGTLHEWQENVAKFCSGNERLIFSLCAAFAPPLLYLLGEESGGVHFVGPSSIGKTLTLKIAGSVWGGGGVNGFLKKWRSTVNGLELLAESRCDSLLLLDEIAEIGARDAAQAVYMLANGSGKKRMGKEQNSLPCAEWRLIFLSSGEIGLANHLAAVGDEHRGGHHVRLIEIDADAGMDLGIFSTIGEYKSSSLLADLLRTNCNKFYGTAINSFLDGLINLKNPDELLNATIRSFLNELDLKTSSGQKLRIAKRFAIFSAAGSLAVRMKILPFSEQDIQDAVQKCFNDWDKGNQHHPDYETGKILTQIRQYLQLNAYAHFPEWDGKSKITFSGKCCGYRLINADGTIEWLILNEVFKHEICKGLDFRKVVRELRNLDILKLDRTGKNSIPLRLPNFGLVRIYHLTPEIFTKGNAIQ